MISTNSASILAAGLLALPCAAASFATVTRFNRAAQPSFAPINSYGNGAFYNVASCAQPCVISVQPGIQCSNANCLCGKADEAAKFLSSCVANACTTDCNDITAAASLLYGFCTSVGLLYDFPLPTLPPINGCSEYRLLQVI